MKVTILSILCVYNNRNGIDIEHINGRKYNSISLYGGATNNDLVFK